MNKKTLLHLTPSEVEPNKPQLPIIIKNAPKIKLPYFWLNIPKFESNSKNPNLGIIITSIITK